MIRHALKRLAWLVPGFVGITFVVFAIVKAAPGDPLSSRSEQLLASASSRAAIDEYRRLVGIDDPLLPAYGKWLARCVRLDLGTSFKDGRPVARKLAEALPVTLLLSLLALLASYLVAVPLGVWGAARPGSVADRVTGVALFALHSLPVQWVAMMLVLWLGVRWNWLPIQGLRTEGVDTWADRARHLVLPLICLSYASLASLSRYARAGLLDVLGQDFIRTARAKGLSEFTVVVRHGLRNSLVGLVTLLGLTLPSLVGGAVIVERIFGLPGMGQLAFDAVVSKDLPVLMGDTALAGVLTMAGLALSDLLHAWLDPRVRSEP